jgi:hypothetical protein
MCYEADLPRGELVAPFVFVVLEAGWSGPRIQRRVVEVGFLPPSGSGELVSWGLPTSDQVQTVGIEALANWTNLSSTQVRAEIDERAVLLEPTTPVGPQR